MYYYIENDKQEYFTGIFKPYPKFVKVGFKKYHSKKKAQTDINYLIELGHDVNFG